MLPNNSVFQRREQHYEQDVEEAEHELAEQQRRGLSLMRVTSMGGVVTNKHIKRGESAPKVLYPMVESSSILVRPQESRELVETHDLEAGIAAGIDILGLRGYEVKVGAGKALWFPQHPDQLDFQRFALGFQRKHGQPKLEQEASPRLENGQNFGILKSSCGCIFGFKRMQEEDEVESAYLETSPSWLPSPVENATVVPERKKSFKRTAECSTSTELAGHALPHELVEKIISMTPFPEIMNARLLSKSWHSNFSSNPETAAFRKQVVAVSSRWTHYCPIILNIDEEWLMGYDREHSQWQKMPLGFGNQRLSKWFSTQKLRGAGSLMCGVYHLCNVFVTNVVTRNWRWLPSRSYMEYPTEIHLIPVGSDAYQVLLITRLGNRTGEICSHLFDSRTSIWTEKHSTVNIPFHNSSSVHLNGILYVMEYVGDDQHDVLKLLSHNLENGTWTEIPHPFGFMLHEIETYELLVCQSCVMVVLHLHSTWGKRNPIHNTFRNTLMVYRLDPVSLDIREVSRGPPEPSTASSTLFASDNDRIYFGNPQVTSSSFVEFNVTTSEWSYLPPPFCTDGSFKNKWGTFPFQPGLNPFVVV